MGRNISGLEATAKAMAVPSLIAAGDVTKPEDAKAVIDKAVAQFGKIDVLINVAAHINHDTMTGEVDPSVWWED